MITLIFWLFVAHFIADYPLQSVEMAKFKNPKNAPIPPPNAKPVPVWFAYLAAHGFIHAGLSALIVGAPLGFLIGVIHFTQDFIKTRVQYSPNLDQIIHLSILVIIAVAITLN